MANNSDLEALLAQVPVADLANKFGIDESTVNAAVKQALPGLLGGMAVNASDADGAEKLVGALDKHQPKSGTISLEAIDERDGKKIVKHVLGDKEEAVSKQLGAQAGNFDIAKLIPMLLPILAPIVMQFLAGRLGGGTAPQTAQAGSQGGIGGVLGDLLGGLLGGGASPAPAQQSGGGLDDLLGGMLGGGSSKSGGGIGGLLGGLLGK